MRRPTSSTWLFPAARSPRTGVAQRTSASGIRYLESWLRGVGAVALDNLMEDAATAEISRSQIWQWLRHGRIERGDVVALEDAALAERGRAAAGTTRARYSTASRSPKTSRSS